MTSMPTPDREIIGGVDTHKELHVAAVVTMHGELLATQQFVTTRTGYNQMIRWFAGHGRIVRVGIEGTGSYGAGLTRRLQREGIEVLNVDRPDRTDRRRRGKSDTIDAEQAAIAALSGRRTSDAKDSTGKVEALRVLRLTRSSAVRARRETLQLIHNQIVSAPDEIRDELRSMTRMQLVRTLAASRPDMAKFRDPTTATRVSLKFLARRFIELGDEIHELSEMVHVIVKDINPKLIELTGVGPESAAELIIAAGENVDRMHSEAAFAMLCGAAPVPASSGKTDRHRLNRGGNRQANSALHMIAVSRIRLDERTRTYIAKKTSEGKSKREAMRCLKRYIAREIFTVLTTQRTT
jgi:transposase